MKNLFKILLYAQIALITSQATASDWWGYTDENVAKAVCRRREPHNSVEIENYFKKLKINNNEESTTNISYKGIEFKQEDNELLSAFIQLTSNSLSHEKNETPEILNLKKKFSALEKCDKVLCASKIIWGDFTGPAMLYLLHKYQINTSNFSFSNSDVFSNDEMLSLVKGLELIPTRLVSLSHNQKLSRFLKGKTYASFGPDSGVLADSKMEIFDLWSDQTNFARQSTIVHEFGHNFSNLLRNNIDSSKTWLTLGDWAALDSSKPEYEREYTQGSRTKSLGVSEYGITNPAEDFAESITTYRLNPHRLKRISINKYNFIKNYVFAGQEFTSQEVCERFDQDIISQKSKKIILSKEQQINVVASCLDSLSANRSSISMGMIYGSYETCAIRKINSLLLASEIDTTDVVPLFNYDRMNPNNFYQIQIAAKESLKTFKKTMSDIVVNDIVNTSSTWSLNSTCNSNKISEYGLAKNIASTLSNHKIGMYGYDLASKIYAKCEQLQRSEKQDSQLFRFEVEMLVSKTLNSY